ncbi:MAG: hypothetical protein GTO63_18785 [Anaerolineae bacterium]|nr:hypothetical protein [Anaerolineae bacterium]NIN96819.1 hypothetical protein [Anaerolineae bacterium]NIQ79803.1 hypothetical protein [Anaerolineae bacterium]
MTQVQDATDRRAQRVRRMLLSAQVLVTLAALTLAVGWSLCLVSSLPSCATLATGYETSIYRGGRTDEEIREGYYASYKPLFYGLAVLGWVAALVFLLVTWPLSWWGSRRVQRRPGTESPEPGSAHPPPRSSPHSSRDRR